MKRAIALLSLAGILLVGCKSTGDSTSSSTDSTQPASTEPGKGVTADTIKVGVVYTDLAAIRDIVKIDHGDYLSAFQALADDINANGGINGRKITIVDGPVNPVGTGAAAVVCTKQTEDTQVFAAIGNLQADQTGCYVTDHDTALVGGQQTGANLATAKAPWFTFNADLDYSADQTIKGVGQSGGFTDKKVAVIYAPVNEALVKGSLSQELSAQGANVVSTAVIDSPPDDQAAVDAQTQTLLEKFRSDGADMIVTVDTAFQVTARNLQKTSYRPQLVATSTNIVEGYLVGSDTSKYEVLGGMVSGGTPSAKVAWTDPALQDCISRIKAQQPDRGINDPTTAGPDTPNTWVSVTVACQSMTLFQAIAEKAGDTLNNDTFRNVGNTLGTFSIPGAGGPSDYTAETPSVNPPIFLAHWNSTANKLDYDTTPVS